MTAGRVTVVLAASLLALSWVGASAASAADLAPGLFGGHPPAGVVAPDNTLTMPQGRPKGFVLVIHGGAWVLTGPRALALEAANIRWFTRLGWGVYNVDYRAGWLSVVDVVAAYHYLRSRHPRAPMCAYGESAGGQLAMLLAASRPSLRCVISAGGVADLTDVPNPIRGLEQHVFHGRLWEFSPVRVASYIRGTLLCAGSSYDRTVPQKRQLAAIRTARPRTRVMLLAGAPTPGGPSFSHPPNFVHASITRAARRMFRRAVKAVLAGASGRSR
jgi:alpha/beta hydrolase fold